MLQHFVAVEPVYAVVDMTVHIEYFVEQPVEPHKADFLSEYKVLPEDRRTISVCRISVCSISSVIRAKLSI